MKENFGNQYNVLEENGIEDRKNRTRIGRDRLKPLLKNEAAGMVSGTLGAGIGAGAGYGIHRGVVNTRKYVGGTEFGADLAKKFGERGKTFGNRINKSVNGRKILKKLENPTKILFSKEFGKYRNLAAAAGGAAYLAPKFREMGKVMDRTKTFQKQHLKSFGTEPTENEYLQAANLNPTKKSHQMAYEMFNTPDALIKSKKRDVTLNNKVNPSGGNIGVSNNSQPARMQMKFAYEEQALMPMLKTAGINNVLSTAQKYAPKAGAIGMGALMGATSGATTSKMVDDDAKFRKTKIALGTAAGAAGGAVLGKRLAGDTSSLASGVYNKILDPKSGFKDSAKDFGKEVYDNYAKNIHANGRKMYEEVKSNGFREAINKVRENVARKVAP